MSVCRCPICDGVGRVAFVKTEDGPWLTKPDHDGDECHACHGRGVIISEDVTYYPYVTPSRPDPLNWWYLQPTTMSEDEKARVIATIPDTMYPNEG